MSFNPETFSTLIDKMALGWVFTVLCGLVLHAASVQAGLHLAHKGLLQYHASFAGKGVSLFPAHHPNHSIDSLDHIVPKINHELYFSQEGHRPSRHGAKHAAMKTKFSRPTIILDHTAHLLSISCGGKSIDACFTPDAFKEAQKTWTEQEFNLVTYHVGCGDEATGARSIFLASQPKFDEKTSCVKVSTKHITHEDAMESGEITWGTYKDPEKAHIPVKGHMRVSTPLTNSFTDTQHPFPRRARSSSSKAAKFVPRQDQDVPIEGLPPLPPGDGWVSDNEMVDLDHNATALIDFFELGDYGLGDNFDQPLPADDGIDTVQMDGTTPTEEQEEDGGIVNARAKIERRRALRRRALQKRWFGEGLWEGLKQLANTVSDFVVSAAKTLVAVVKKIVDVAVISAKLIAVPFGVPFDESFNNDYEISYDVKYTGSNRPPQIFEYTDGFNLAGSGDIFTVQCAKCGVHGELSTEGHLAFSIQNGITEGYVALNNDRDFTIDAIFGLTLESQFDKPIKSLGQQIAAIPLSPLAIPGIITLGPEITIKGAVDLILNGKAELLIGGTLSIGPGRAQLSVVAKKANKLQGFTPSFKPVAKFQGLNLSATLELGLPIAIEVGLDVLNGKFKKSVGLINKPSIYGTAAVSIGGQDPNACQGVEISIGAKNRIYVNALDLWDYDIRTDIIFHKALGCVTPAGFSNPQPAPGLIQQVTKKVGRDLANNIPKIRDVAATLKPPKPTNNAGYRVIMDQDKTSILVSGRDGHVYLVSTSEAYDLSAPWGSVDVDYNAFSLDVFGRVVSYMTDVHSRIASVVKVWDPQNIPADWRAGAFTLVKEDGKQTYLFAITNDGTVYTYYPTFCKTPQGLRLYPTFYLIDKDGHLSAPDDYLNELNQGFSDLGISSPQQNCRTVWLSAV
ncbi:hypothetical protein GGS20DRAFT_535201 [Poronia punctata]|nr:hypothetical protein GGS20DRAFT_535201 [Poronia punctata]